MSERPDRCTHTRRRALVMAGASLALAAGLYPWAARRLQWRRAWIPPGTPVDAVYVLAGEQVQAERTTAAARYVAGLERSPPIIMAPDNAKGPWSREHQRNLSAMEWARRRLDQTLRELDRAETEVLTVPGGPFWGTDEELDALGDFIRARPDLERVVIVTSRTHIRRALRRARRHLGGRVIGAVPAAASRKDYLPWIVIPEWLKLARDQLGLARAPLLSRQWWVAACGHG